MEEERGSGRDEMKKMITTTRTCNKNRRTTYSKRVPEESDTRKKHGRPMKR